jgi:hypothetical protein
MCFIFYESFHIYTLLKSCLNWIGYLQETFCLLGIQICSKMRNLNATCIYCKARVTSIKISMNMPYNYGIKEDA